MGEPLQTQPTTRQAAAPDEVEALVQKHHAEIERIRALAPSAPLGTLDQQGEFAKYGIDTEALKAHYQDMRDKNDELMARAKSSNRRTAITGFGAFLATAAAGIWKREKIAPKNLLLQGSVIAAFATTAGIVVANIGSYIFNRKIRIESRDFVQEAGRVFERELAIAIENKERADEARAAMPADETPPDAPGFAADLSRSAPPAPRAGHVAEALKEKAIAQNAAAQLS